MKKKSKASKEVSLELYESKVLEILKKENRPLLLREIYHLLGIPSQERKLVRDALKSLENKEKVVKIKRRKYGLPQHTSLVKGKLRVHPEGFGFVEGEEGETVFVPPRKVGKALDGDVVLVRIERIAPKGPEGKVVKVLERKRKHITGYLIKRKKFYFVEPEDPHLPFEIYIPKKKLRGAKKDHLVVAKILENTSKFGFPSGEIVKDLGDPESLEAHVWAVIFSQDLPHEWNKKIKRQVARLPEEVRDIDKEGRRDLTNLNLVTIDGENARDFDDAIYVEKSNKGFRLVVAIADVAHYVVKDSALDREAYLRGTSVYFPNMVVPMFPEKLSNGLCSLNPLVERLAMVVDMKFSKNGELLERDFYPAVIKSHARLTYTEVKRMIEDRDKEVVKKYENLFPMLEAAAELADILRQKRLSRGSLDFDIPEPQVVFDIHGEIENIVKRERNKAHMLIEDFMIAANEVVAEFLTEKGYPFLYRVHDAPDVNKLEKLLELLRSYGLDVKLPKKLSPLEFQKIVNSISERENAEVFHSLMLRSLKRAQYSPENIGHFGLASECYCHFTSPIRRYPDLVVHRTLKRALKKKKPLYDEETLEVMGKFLSERERIAEEAEREVLKRFQVFFMKDKVGKVFEGYITGVTAFGFFVELKEYMVSGVVRVIDLPDDFYVLNEDGTCLKGQNSGNTFCIGQRLKVLLKSVDTRKFFINFELAE